MKKTCWFLAELGESPSDSTAQIFWPPLGQLYRMGLLEKCTSRRVSEEAVEVLQSEVMNPSGSFLHVFLINKVVQNTVLLKSCYFGAISLSRELASCLKAVCFITSVRMWGRWSLAAVDLAQQTKNCSVTILPGLESYIQVPQVHWGTKVDSSGNSAKSDSKIGKNRTKQKATKNHNQLIKPQTNTKTHTHHYWDNYENIIYRYVSYKT